jgi:hypothetical protein
MQNTILFLLVVFMTTQSFSQTMNVHKNDGTTVPFTLSQIDSITFTATSLLFQEDFESYAANSFPSSGGWVLLHNGAGDSYQIVTTAQHHSGEKAMQLKGSLSSWWAAHMYRPIQFTQSPINVELWLMASNSNTGNAEDMGRFLFNDLATAHEWPGTYLYATDGTIRAHIGSTNQSLGQFVANQWYKIRMRLDFTNHKIDVWVNDTWVGQNISGTFLSNSYDIFELGAEHGNTTFYFDDIIVWRE